MQCKSQNCGFSTLASQWCSQKEAANLEEWKTLSLLYRKPCESRRLSQNVILIFLHFEDYKQVKINIQHCFGHIQFISGILFCFYHGVDKKNLEIQLRKRLAWSAVAFGCFYLMQKWGLERHQGKMQQMNLLTQKCNSVQNTRVKATLRKSIFFKITCPNPNLKLLMSQKRDRDYWKRDTWTL